MSIRTVSKGKDIWFFFRGFLTDDILSGIPNAFKLRLSCDDVDKQTAKSAFYIFVELIQNIVRYSAKSEVIESPWQTEELKFGTFAVGRGKKRIFLSSENLIENDKVSALRNQLSEIEALDDDGRKRLYKEMLRKKPPKGSKGAGVGFVEIARKATLGFEYSFVDVDENFSQFTFTAYL